MIFVYIAVFFLVFSPVKAEDDASPLSIVEKVERNLIYSNEIERQNNTEGIIIKKGAWNQEEAQKFEESQATSKKINAEVKKTKNDSNVLALKRKAYDAITIGQYEVAVELYKQALKINKDDIYSTLGLATAYQYLGQYVQAKPLYLKVLEVFPADQQVMSNLLAIVSIETPYEAVYLLSSMADRNLSSPLIQAQTSIAYSKIKNYDKAIEYIKRAIEIDGMNLEYRYNLAVLYDLNQNYSQARVVYNELINLGSTRSSGENFNLPIDEIKDRIVAINAIIDASDNTKKGNKKK